MNELISGPEISESDSKTFWKFVDKCRLALDATESSETFRSNLATPYTQELIAKRLGQMGFKEWSWHRQGLQMKDKEVTFQTFYTWIERKARTLIVCKKNEPAQRNQPRESISQQSQYRSPQVQGQRGPYIRYQPSNQNRSQKSPGAPIFCAWCRESKLQDSHSTRDCTLFKEASNAAQWTALNKQAICPLCLIGSHGVTYCPEYKGQASRCTQCKYTHSRLTKCRPLNPQNQQH